MHLTSSQAGRLRRGKRRGGWDNSSRGKVYSHFIGASLFLSPNSFSFQFFSSTLSLVEARDGDWCGQVSVDSPAAAASLGTLWGSARKLAARGIFRQHHWCIKVPQRLQQHCWGGVFLQRVCQLELQHQHNGPQLRASGRTTSGVLSLEGGMLAEPFSHSWIKIGLFRLGLASTDTSSP